MNTIIHNFRSIGYGLVMAIGIVFLQQIGTGTSFIVCLTCLAIIMGIEIYLSYRHAVIRLKQFDLYNGQGVKSEKKIVYYLIYPLVLFLAIVGFIYTNNRASLTWLYLLGSFVLFTLLFINVRAHYEQKYNLEEDTNVIFSIIKVFAFFALVNTCINISLRYGFNFYIVTGIIFVSGSLLTMLLLLNRQHQYFHILLVICAGLVIGYLTGVLYLILTNRALLISFYSTLVFYMLNGLIKHDLDRTLDLALVVEYLLVGGISLSVVLILP